MISVKEACEEIISEHPEKNYDLKHLINHLHIMGGERFICTDDMWRCYGKRKFYNTLLREKHHMSSSALEEEL